MAESVFVTIQGLCTESSHLAPLVGGLGEQPLATQAIPCPQRLVPAPAQGGAVNSNAIHL